MSRKSSRMSGISISGMSRTNSKTSPRFDQTLSSIDSSPGKKSKHGQKKKSIADSNLIQSLMLSRDSVNPISEKGTGMSVAAGTQVGSDVQSPTKSNKGSANAISLLMQKNNISI